jgi:CRP-like cAMP-binding protein
MQTLGSRRMRQAGVPPIPFAALNQILKPLPACCVHVNTGRVDFPYDEADDDSGMERFSVDISRFGHSCWQKGSESSMSLSLSASHSRRKRPPAIPAGYSLLSIMSRGAALAPDEVALLDGSHRLREAWAGSEIADNQSAGFRVIFVVAGWLGRSRDLKNGRRQLIDLFLPGEMMFRRPDTPAELLSYSCLSDVQYIDLSELLTAVEAEPSRYANLAAAFRAFSTDVERGLIKQIVRLGAMRAAERMADLALDLYRRSDLIGQCVGERFPMLLSQEQIGSLLGMSAVHVNRTMQFLRQQGLLVTNFETWMLPDCARLQRIGEHANDVPVAGIPSLV